MPIISNRNDIRGIYILVNLINTAVKYLVSLLYLANYNLRKVGVLLLTLASPLCL